MEECRIDYLLVSMSENQTRVSVDTYCYTIFNFAWGILKTGVSILPFEFCLIEGLEAYEFGGTVLVYSSSGRRNSILGFYLDFSIEFARSEP